MPTLTDTRRPPAEASARASIPRNTGPRECGDTRMALRALLALVTANRRYWLGLSRPVRAQLRHWHARAEAIEDPEMRALALAKLRDEAFNAQVAAVVATLAPRAHRAAAARAIVALELLFDCLDGLTERPHEDPLAEGERLFEVFLAAVDPERELPAHADPYLIELAASARVAITTLPASAAILPTARACARRTVGAQVRMHATPILGPGPLTDWGHAQACGTDLGWREYLASSAANVLTLHTLVTAAADLDTAPDDARRIDDAYLSICAVTTLIDAIVDESADRARGELGYITLYEDRDLLAASLAHTAREATRKAAALPAGGHHLMTLAGGIAYWCSHPDARERSAANALAPLRRELQHLIAPPLQVMRAWRAAKSLSAGRAPNTRAACSDTQ